jgi:hypothetical protein
MSLVNASLRYSISCIPRLVAAFKLHNVAQRTPGSYRRLVEPRVSMAARSARPRSRKARTAGQPHLRRIRGQQRGKQIDILILEHTCR